MKSIKSIFFGLSILAGSVLTVDVKAESIMLQNLYGIVPMDDSPITWEQEYPDNGNPNLKIAAAIEGNVVKVDFDQPAGNVEVVISQNNGMSVHRQNAFNPQSMTIDMNGAEAGRYLLEVYTDTEAVGGVFEVK